jgi:triacylglycerol lipase|tara:strand:- start:323 stop:1111 length:789 start_codon:yes stop_codon:yes gene_type:complete
MIEFEHEKQRRLVFAKFSKYAYLNPDEARTAAKVEGFPKTEFVDIDGAQAYVFYNKTDLIIACRGTQVGDMNDIYADLQVFQADSVTGNKIHQGFKEEVDKIYDDVESILARRGQAKKIWCCGHSLGGAMVTILAQRLEFKGGYDVDTLYTYGSPRAGGPKFRAWCDKHLNHQRFVNNNDVVPCVPTFFRWRHSGECNYIKSTGEVTNLGRWSSERIRDKGWSLIKTMFKGRFDLVSDHNINDYILHLENSRGFITQQELDT